VSDGTALLIALTRRKGSPAALADWLLERVPETVPPGGQFVLGYVYGPTLARVEWAARVESAVWVRMVFKWGVNGMGCDCKFHVDLTSPQAGYWLAKYLNETFIRRRAKRRRP
jgi:hypothetical protein